MLDVFHLIVWMGVVLDWHGLVCLEDCSGGGCPFLRFVVLPDAQPAFLLFFVCMSWS